VSKKAEQSQILVAWYLDSMEYLSARTRGESSIFGLHTISVWSPTIDRLTAHWRDLAVVRPRCRLRCKAIVACIYDANWRWVRLPLPRFSNFGNGKAG